MLYKVVLQWLYTWLTGVGCSLIAAGLVGIVTEGAVPLAVAFCLVTGFAFMVLALVVGLLSAIPNDPEGE